jgi:hypothetical protein
MGVREEERDEGKREGLREGGGGEGDEMRLGIVCILCVGRVCSLPTIQTSPV